MREETYREVLQGGEERRKGRWSVEVVGEAVLVTEDNSLRKRACADKVAKLTEYRRL